MKNITEIYYPNTAIDENIGSFTVGRNCDEIKYITKNGEMAAIGWFQIIKDNHVIAEIKESVCNVYGSDEVEKDIF